MLELFVFQAGKGGRSYGITVDPTGANLPPESAPWRPPAGGNVPRRIIDTAGTDAAIAALKGRGYYVAEAEAANVIRPTFWRRR
jgi:hypothetical protein